MAFLIRKLFVIYFISGLFQIAGHAGSWDPQLGNPIYVLEQTKNAQGVNAFRLIEARPPERVFAQFYAGSRALAQGEGMVVKNFGFVDFQINDHGIQPGIALVLDTSGGLWKQRIVPEGFNQSLSHWQRIPGNYSLLEQDADQKLFAVTAAQEIVSVDANANVFPVNEPSIEMSKREKIIALHADHDASLTVLTNNRLIQGKRSIPFHRTLSEQAQVYPNNGVFWITDAGLQKIFFIGRDSDDMLEHSFEEHVEQRQDGAKLDALGANSNLFYFRLGGHAYQASFTKTNNRFHLTIKAIAIDVFADKGRRDFAINYMLYTKLSVMQPRHAERGIKVRSDIPWQNNPQRTLQQPISTSAQEEHPSPSPLSSIGWEESSPFYMPPSVQPPPSSQVFGEQAPVRIFGGCSFLLLETNKLR